MPTDAPTLTSTQEQQRPLPVEQLPFMTPAASGAQIGESLQGAASHIGQIANEERAKVSQMEAMDAITAYEHYLFKEIYDTKNGFSAYKGRDASEHYLEKKDQIEKAREELAEHLHSRTAQRDFLSSSIRPFIRANEHVDAHTAHQSKLEGDAIHNGFQLENAQNAARTVIESINSGESK